MASSSQAQVSSQQPCFTSKATYMTAVSDFFDKIESQGHAIKALGTTNTLILEWIEKKFGIQLINLQSPDYTSILPTAEEMNRFRKSLNLLSTPEVDVDPDSSAHPDEDLAPVNLPEPDMVMQSEQNHLKNRREAVLTSTPVGTSSSRKGRSNAESRTATNSLKRRGKNLGSPQQPQQAKSSFTQEIQHKCRYCTRLYLRKEHKDSHERRHTGGKPHKCQYCSKTFRHLSGKNIHEQRIHTGERRFTCEYCAKRFTTAFQLEVHLRVHTGEKPYFCHICSTSYSTSSALRAHERSLRHQSEQSEAQSASAV